MNEAWQQFGSPKVGGVLLVGDHAANVVPDDVNLAISNDLLINHIALDIGVVEVAAHLTAGDSVDCAILGGVSRLVIDLNREVEHPGLIPENSDGHIIGGNCALTKAECASRIARFYDPYHNRLDAVIASFRPKLILSLHSFTPRLSCRPDEVRPWDIGILYNQDDRLAAPAIAALTADGWHVGDQLPYSGKLLNATMNRHAEANGIPYIGVEMRQDHSGSPAGHAAMAASLGKMLTEVRNLLA